MTTIYSPSFSAQNYVAPPVPGKPKTPKSYIKRIIFGIAVFVVVVGLLVMAYFIFLGNSSVKGEVKTVPIRENTDLSSRSKQLSLKGQYFSMNYAPVYATQDTQVRTNNVFESFSYVASTVYDKRMAVAIQKQPTGGIMEESSYKMRTIYTDKYTERKTKTGDGLSAIVMTKKTDGTNKESVLFISNNSLLATIALVVTGGDDDLEKEIDKIAASFKWNK
ncbi:MAG TPA: hypothetical protein VF272_00820 [Candidatus Saccharimonadia bacterium]